MGSLLYDEAYWTKHLDVLAQNRFNSLVVIFGYENGGFLAPCYLYFFDVDGFPDVRMVGITPEQQQRNLAALNRLIQMAHDRGLNFTVGIWDHIYRGEAHRGAGCNPFTVPALKLRKHFSSFRETSKLRGIPKKILIIPTLDLKSSLCS